MMKAYREVVLGEKPQTDLVPPDLDCSCGPEDESRGRAGRSRDFRRLRLESGRRVAEKKAGHRARPFLGSDI